MQTLAVEVQDGYIQNFLNYIHTHSEHITLTKDKNLEIDPYFYERRKELHQIKNDIDSGKIKMVENNDFWDDIDNFVETLQK